MNTARLVHPGFWFDKTPLSQALALARRGVGGFCLYGGTRAQIAAFTAAVRRESPLPYLLISADYEDGLGRWVHDAPLLPSNLALGAAADPQLAFEKGLLTARQARSLGVDWVFAPVVDLADNPLNPIVNTRSFGKEPSLVTAMAGAFLDGLKQGGALSCLKHFPGHGDTTTDSHLALPVVQKTPAQLRPHELVPFEKLLSKTDSIMTGHLFLPQLDAQNPASLSRHITGDLLRKQLGYRGCVLTDALLMKAIGDEKQAALSALQAGADILLVPEKPQELLDFLEGQSLPSSRLARSEQIQNRLCARVQGFPPCSQEQAFAPNTLNQKTAEKALVQTGVLPTLQPGQTVAYIEVGNTQALSARPFLDALKAGGICPVACPAKADILLVLSFRRYRAFEGKIALDEPEQETLRRAACNYPQVFCVLFASPWALQGVLPARGHLYTFSPAPQFMQMASSVLLGQKTARGTCPVDV